VARRRLGFAYRGNWGPLIAIDLLFITHWGVVTAFLPQRAEAAGANVGLFFIADGVVVLLSRVPTGYFVDRVRPVVPILLGLVSTSFAIVLLAMPPATPLLTAAGCLTGLGGAFVITPLLVEMARRSADADRGSAFSLLSAANATALAIGSIGGAVIVAASGFEAAILSTLIAMAGGALVASRDAALRAERADGRREIRDAVDVDRPFAFDVARQQDLRRAIGQVQEHGLDTAVLDREDDPGTERIDEVGHVARDITTRGVEEVELLEPDGGGHGDRVRPPGLASDALVPRLGPVAAG